MIKQGCYKPSRILIHYLKNNSLRSILGINDRHFISVLWLVSHTLERSETKGQKITQEETEASAMITWKVMLLFDKTIPMILDIYEVTESVWDTIAFGDRSNFRKEVPFLIVFMYLLLPVSVRAESDMLSGCNSTSSQQMEAQSVFAQTEKARLSRRTTPSLLHFPRWSG